MSGAELNPVARLEAFQRAMERGRVTLLAANGTAAVRDLEPQPPVEWIEVEKTRRGPDADGWLSSSTKRRRYVRTSLVDSEGRVIYLEETIERIPR